MKKILTLTLLFVTLIASPMWAATAYYAKVKSANSSQGQVSWSSSSGWTGETTVKKVTTTTSLYNFYVKPADGYQFDYAIRSASTSTKLYLNSSFWSNTQSNWSTSTTYYTFSIKQNSIGGSSNTTEANAYTITVYFKKANTLTFKDEDGTVLKTYSLKDNQSMPSASDLISIRPTKEDDANNTYTFKGWYNGSTEYVGGYGKYITSDVTYTAVYTATPKADYVTATFKQADGTTNFCEPQQVVPGETPTAPAGTPVKAQTNTTVYTFDRWNTAADGSGNDLTVAIDADAVYYPVFTESTRYYTVRFLNYDGSVISAIDDAVYESNVIEPAEDPVRDATDTKVYTFNGWSPAVGVVTGNQDYVAQFIESDRTYTIRFINYDGSVILESQVQLGELPIAPEDPVRADYSFSGWSPAVTEVTGDQDYIATFDIPAYTITIGACTNGYVTLTTNGSTITVPAEGGSYPFEEGMNIAISALNERHYHFVKWIEDDSEAVKRMIREIDEDVTLTPTFDINNDFTIYDTWDETTCKSTIATAEGVLSVTLEGRSYTTGDWSTISLPFDLNMNTGDDLYGDIYAFAKADLGKSGNSVTIEFNRTYVIEANAPYLVIPTKNVTNPLFDGVRFVTPAETALSSDSKVFFTSSLWQQNIYGPADFYVGTHNTLRYARRSDKGGTMIKGNSAFFRKAGESSAPMRVRARIDGVEQEIEITEDGDIQPVENTRKYMENGILVIERNGIRYDAQGKRID